ncbi:hypothetical protein [Streptomyces sp. NPDC058254]|uniref:hypothetical protein n=1 Tax=Streptomyces sp. NPDC058254 TaxID=3346406 RepID=UPI0036E28B93
MNAAVSTSITSPALTSYTTRRDAGRVRVHGGLMRPAAVLGDKGYSSRTIRAWLRHRSISHIMPERADQVRNS